MRGCFFKKDFSVTLVYMYVYVYVDVCVMRVFVLMFPCSDARTSDMDHLPEGYDVSVEMDDNGGGGGGR